MDVEAVAVDGQDPVQDPKPDEKDYRGQVTMESGGTVEMTDPDYVEEDDVMNSIGEGNF